MKKKIALVALAAAAVGVQAAEWSDTSIGIAHGNKFAEPFEGANIPKNIYNLTHASGYKYGSNFFNVDMLDSSSKDPSVTNGSAGAHEIYVIYRNTVDFTKVTGKEFKTTGVRGLGFTGGFDFSSKSAGINAKKEMVVAGPTVFLDVPAGFLNVSLLQAWESAAPNTVTSRHHYKPHPILALGWGIPFTAGVPLSFEGVASFIANKGVDTDQTTNTVHETFVDLRLMYDVSAAVGTTPNTFKVGAEYQYWKNKFGVDASTNSGAFAKTPMVRAEYHF